MTLQGARRAMAATALLAAASGVSAQTFDDAVRGNFALATVLCVQSMLDGSAPAFQAAGFVYRGEDRGINEYGIHRGTGHYFDAPVDTAKAEVMNVEGHPGLCTVTTKHLVETDVATLVSSVLSQRYPATQPQNPRSWHVPGPGGLPLIIGVSTIGTNNRYETPGTVQVSMGYPG